MSFYGPHSSYPFNPSHRDHPYPPALTLTFLLRLPVLFPYPYSQPSPYIHLSNTKWWIEAASSYERDNLIATDLPSPRTQRTLYDTEFDSFYEVKSLTDFDERLSLEYNNVVRTSATKSEEPQLMPYHLLPYPDPYPTLLPDYLPYPCAHPLTLPFSTGGVFAIGFNLTISPPP